MKEITKLVKTSPSDFTLFGAELLHIEERRGRVLPQVQFCRKMVLQIMGSEKEITKLGEKIPDNWNVI